jgi:hypothetical protein
MYILEPLDRLAYAAAAPIKGRDTNIASLPFPLTICRSVDAQLGEASEVHDKGKEKLEKCMIRVVSGEEADRPAGVPQHMFLSSI